MWEKNAYSKKSIFFSFEALGLHQSFNSSSVKRCKLQLFMNEGHARMRTGSRRALAPPGGLGTV